MSHLIGLLGLVLSNEPNQKSVGSIFFELWFFESFFIFRIFVRINIFHWSSFRALCNNEKTVNMLRILIMGVGCYGNTFPCFPAKITILWEFFWGTIISNNESEVLGYMSWSMTDDKMTRWQDARMWYTSWQKKVYNLDFHFVILNVKFIPKWLFIEKKNEDFEEKVELKWRKRS